MDNILNEDAMMERGKFKANGYTFIVRPVYLGEEDEYISQVTVSPIPLNSNGEIEFNREDDKSLGLWPITLFSWAVNGTKKEKHGRLYNFFSFIFKRKDYRYYSNFPAIQPLIMWIERKVTYNGKKVKFYELERKYGLSKADIERLFIYFHELSGF